MDCIRSWLAMFGSTGPEASVGLVYGLALCGLCLGLGLLIWGRFLARPVMGLITAAAAISLGSLIANASNMPLGYARIGCAIIVGAIGFALARICWAIAGGVIVASIAAATVLLAYVGPPPAQLAEILQAVAGQDIHTWSIGLGQFVWTALQLAASGHEAVFFPAVGASLTLALVLLTLRLKLATVLVCTLLGAIGITFGGCAISLSIRPEIWDGIRYHFYIPGGIIAGLWAFGAIYQSLKTRPDLEDSKDQPSADMPEPPAAETRDEKKAKRKRQAKAE